MRLKMPYPGHVILFKDVRKNTKTKPDVIGAACSQDGQGYYMVLWQKTSDIGRKYLQGKIITKEKFESFKEEDLEEITNFEDLPF